MSIRAPKDSDEERRPSSAVRNPERGARRFSDLEVLLPLVLMVGAVAALFMLLTYVYSAFTLRGAFLPENNLPVALVTAVIALLLAVAVLAIVYRRLGLHNRRSALGLPEGSVRAVIALLLIVLFFITAIFLYSDTGRRERGTLRGVTAEQAQAIPGSDILAQVPNESDGTLLDITLARERPAASQDIAKQLVTTVSTLVVAVSAFYFGANSVQTAVGAVSASATSGGGGQHERDKPGPGGNGRDDELGDDDAEKAEPANTEDVRAAMTDEGANLPTHGGSTEDPDGRADLRGPGAPAAASAPARSAEVAKDVGPAG